MNLETLKRLNKVTQAEWRGEAVHLRKISAQDGLRLMALIREEKDRPRTPEQDRSATVDYHAQVISKSVCDAAGELQLDNDAGRDELKRLSLEELSELGELCLRHSGMAGSEQKKS